MADSENPLLFLRVPKSLDRRRLRAFALRLRDELAGGRGFRCLLTDDRELRRLNREFLGKDFPTDVLAFPEPAPDGFLGEIAVSVERAAAQAREYGHSTGQEVRILMLHGLLHLLGFDHRKDRGRMRRAETRWRARLRLPSGLIERTRR